MFKELLVRVVFSIILLNEFVQMAHVILQKTKLSTTKRNYKSNKQNVVEFIFMNINVGLVLYLLKP